MKEIHKQWFINMIDNEINEQREIISNERIWWLGSDIPEEREAHCENVVEHNNYMDMLYEIKTLSCDKHGKAVSGVT